MVNKIKKLFRRNVNTNTIEISKRLANMFFRDDEITFKNNVRNNYFGFASFIGTYDDFDPWKDTNGKHIVFYSNRSVLNLGKDSETDLIIGDAFSDFINSKIGKKQKIDNDFIYHALNNVVNFSHTKGVIGFSRYADIDTTYLTRGNIVGRYKDWYFIPINIHYHDKLLLDNNFCRFVKYLVEYSSTRPDTLKEIELKEFIVNDIRNLEDKKSHFRGVLCRLNEDIASINSKISGIRSILMEHERSISNLDHRLENNIEEDLSSYEYKVFNNKILMRLKDLELENIPIGDLICHIQLNDKTDYGKTNLHITGYNVSKLVHGYNHPHISEEGSICFGDNSESIYRLSVNKDYRLLLWRITQLLNKYSRRNPYKQVEYWTENYKEEDDEEVYPDDE